MRIINLSQGTPEWLEWREERLMASEAPVVMGVAPDWWTVKSWDDLRALKASLGDDKPDNTYLEAAASRGHAIEKRVIEALYGRFGTTYLPAVVEHRDGVFAASLDGLGHNEEHDERTWVEVKAPLHRRQSKLWRGLIEADDSGMGRLFPRAGVPDEVWWQLVHQAYVIFDDPDHEPAGSMTLAVIVDEDDPASSSNLYRRIPIKALLACAPELVEEWESYLTGRPQVPSLGEPFLDAAARYREAKMMQERAAADLEAARNELLSHIGDREKVNEGGVKITKVVSQGRTNWQSAANALAKRAGLDAGDLAEDYRGKQTVSYRITA